MKSDKVRRPREATTGPDSAAGAVALRLARAFLLPRWFGLTVGSLCAVAAAVCTGALATLLQPAVGPLLSKGGGVSALGDLPLILAALALGRALAAIAQSMIANRIGLDLVSSIQVQLVEKLLHADLARLRGAHTGSFLSQVLNDAGLVREAATTGFLNYIQSALTLVVLVVVMLTKDWVLTLLVLLVGPVVAWVLRDFSKRANKAMRGASDGAAALTTVVLESLAGVRVVKMEGREDFERDRMARVIAERRKHIISGADTKAAAAPTSEFLTMLLVAGVIAYVDWREHMPTLHFGPIPIQGMSAGAFTAFLVALMAAGQSLRQFSSLQTVMAEGIAGARRLFTALDIEPEIRDRPGAAVLPRGDGNVSIEAITFAYADHAPVLLDLSLEARRGEIVALVGPSGGGKTTILALIPRFYDVDLGQVTIDGYDVRDVTLASLRAQIALVTQEPFLFDDTIAANIAYSRPQASQDEIEAAARQAAAHDFILGLPKGYQTRVGEAGLRLSGGQRQRIAIARAFLKDAPILLLDEATSALDTESEAQVQAALTRLMAGRTTILIAHRLSTVRGADRIYVIDHGRVVETGSHAELIRRGALYARLAGAQNLDAVVEAT
jgi:subfamily B ATP-binding cassette protein MsbA